MWSSLAVTAVLIWGVSWGVRVQRCFTCTSENDRELMATLQSLPIYCCLCMRIEDHTYAVGGGGEGVRAN